MSKKPVNCATGNEVESQQDLLVGGLGPGLSLTRTYNAQLAAEQTSPGRRRANSSLHTTAKGAWKASKTRWDTSSNTATNRASWRASRSLAKPNHAGSSNMTRHIA